MYKSRVRSCATCTVNSREEQLWSAYSPTTFCRWERKVPSKAAQEEAEETVAAVATAAAGGSSGWTISVLLFVVVALLTVVVALILGQIAV